MELGVLGDGRLIWPGGVVRCALGGGGLRHDKREGDRATPIGRFPLRRVLWRADRLARPTTALALARIERDDGWCDDALHPAYNRPVKLPFAASHEVLWRDDHVYDLIVVVGHNDDPVVPGHGSAIFIHLARDDWEPTAGCVALAQPDLSRILAACGPGCWLNVAGP